MSQRKSKKKRKNFVTTRVSVLVIEDEKILLVKHRKGSQEYWVLPGGRLEYGETFVDCAVREMKEETGLDVEPEKFLFLSEAIAPDLSRHIVNVYLKAKVVGGTMCLGDEPILAGLDFLPLAELEETTLFPPIGKIIGDTFAKNSKTTGVPEIRYLGNLWA